MGKIVSYFYVLYCKDESFYGGYTTDLVRREKEHNTGEGAKYTKPITRRPVKMIYAEEFKTRSEATKAEYAFKKQSRKKKEQFLRVKGIKFPVDLSQSCIINNNLINVKEAEPIEKPKEF
ncbi:GIY-YIG nuclease family protein [Carnobacterium funditum]|uniref:GIY-YIG nuclease family protein n=1 Tax=Carnobacterium funditum TaxID=2752 RepID=UPI0005555F8E|nr:GIY-YIG nuclease family protein [Carnobacterium funditum]